MREFNFSNVTISKYFKFFRSLIEQYYFIFENNRKIGGENKVVEIDECCLFRRKYNVGQVVNQVWIFGGIERGENGKCFFEKVQNRSANTLTEIIKRRIESKTLIMSDCWKGYKDIKNNEYYHFQVNHSLNFVNPNNNYINTQKIESTWNTLKKHFKTKGTNNRINLEEYLLEFMLRKENKDVYSALINVMKKLNNF